MSGYEGDDPINSLEVVDVGTRFHSRDITVTDANPTFIHAA